jgi:hypothetical protein
VLNSYAVRGWHCTRPTDAEVEAIRQRGMQMPDQKMLERRIDALVQNDVVTPTTSAILKSKNHARETR